MSVIHQSDVMPIERAICIHSAHPYHFIDMTSGKWAGTDGMARALAEDYQDLSDLRALVRKYCESAPGDTALHADATRLKCFE